MRLNGQSSKGPVLCIIKYKHELSKLSTSKWAIQEYTRLHNDLENDRGEGQLSISHIMMPSFQVLLSWDEPLQRYSNLENQTAASTCNAGFEVTRKVMVFNS